MMGRNKKWAHGPLFSPIVLLDVAPIHAGPNKKPRSGAFITKAFTLSNIPKLVDFKKNRLAGLGDITR